MGVTRVGMDDVHLGVLHVTAKGAGAEYIRLISEGEGKSHDLAPTMIVRQETTAWPADQVNTMSLRYETLDEPTCLLLTTTPSGLFVKMKYVHDKMKWRARKRPKSFEQILQV